MAAVFKSHPEFKEHCVVIQKNEYNKLLESNNREEFLQNLKDCSAELVTALD